MQRIHSRRLSFQSFEERRLLAAVDIPDDLSAAPSAIVSAPVNIDTAAGVRAAEIRLSYDTSVLDIDPDAISLGSVWGTNTDAQITANVDDAAGTIVIFVSASSELTGISGSLVELPFEVADDASVDSTTVLDLSLVTLNEGQIAVDPTPVAGTDSTDGLLTITGDAVGTDTISGFVYADADNDDAIGVGEAIPGVTITLVNTATGSEQQTTTAADGSYQFTQLAPGTYRIEESQPSAYLDGGSNELTVTLTEDSSLENQNFQELGLLPQFIYTRLLTTPTLPVGSTAWNQTIAQINTDANSEANAAASQTTATTESSVADTTPTDDTSSNDDSAAAGEPIAAVALATEPIVAAAGEPLPQDDSTATPPSDAVLEASDSTFTGPATVADEDDEETAAKDEVFSNNLF
ncbi:cohesin domain-containing protein [Rhodopirellula sallentina]|uniref:Fibrinogen-binding protein n=1 Tax=Rhodopirellula sallentina SM41 TaxID=1263870 RepID=M5U545_9BACT|nr:cohesin domain-containing protein [Rhodopirellula sallentina]EMI56389.1 fibrinogen-binding protein [Rhodopirellula sallentina SM41]